MYYANRFSTVQYTRTYVCMDASILCVCIRVHTYVCNCTMCMYVRMYVCVHVHVCSTYVRTDCTYIRTYVVRVLVCV